MPEAVMCKKCNNLVNDWCEKVIDSPDPDIKRDCQHFKEKTVVSDLISRSAAKEEILSWAVCINKPNLLNRDDAMTVLDLIPAVDAAEVVRCKDCAVPHNKWTGCPNMNGLVPPPEHFCSYGERKDHATD